MSHTATICGQSSLKPSDRRLIRHAMNATNGDKFRRLFEGHIDEYESHSEADLAFCNMLSFWTLGDEERIDRLFRASGLMRRKWNERRGSTTYGQRTIRFAIETHTPKREFTTACPTTVLELCRELQAMKGDGPFHLSCREAAERLQQSSATTSRRLQELVKSGLLILIRKGDYGSRLATTYRLVRDPESDGTGDARGNTQNEAA